MKVSIIIPYNKSRGFLGDAIKSAEHQEGWRLGKDYEIIVQHGDYTLGKNMNDALKKAKGKYIKGLADDDMLAPGCLEALYNFAVKGKFDFVCADAYMFEGDKKVIERTCSTLPVTVRHLAEANTFHGGTVLYRRAIMPEWREDLWTGEEYEYNLRIAAAGCKFGKLDEIVYWYRVHINQKSLVYKCQESHRILERIRYIRDIIQWDYLSNNSEIVK